mmetsp:Transcript_28347/g.31766  ORF Transcript_28347/g.31766 Transcript_28347/m.31766 type:complete len:704 (+) Transcript_28347:274-2385(+)
MSQRKQKHRDINGDEEDDNRSMTSQRSSLSSLSQRSRSSMKKGMNYFGKGIKKVFKSPKKRRKKKKGGGEGDDDESCGSAASYGSSHSLPLSSSSPRSPRRNEEWTAPESANGRGSGPVDVDTVEDSNNGEYDQTTSNTSLTSSIGGRPSQSRPSRISLPKVVEGDNEDYDSTSDHLGSIKNSSSHHKKNKRSPLTVFSNHKKNKNRHSAGGSVSSRGSKHTNRFSPSPVAPTPARKADELSLVILLVDPTSLRFELLSLDFDLATHQVTPTNQQQEEQKKNNKKNKSPRKSSKTSEKNEPTASSASLSFTVQDVLDQITPESLTEETIKHNLLFKTTPIGLIDRTDQIHFGAASLDAVCSSRPLRNIMDCDFQKRLQLADPTSTPGPISLSLCDLTYSGTPHRDVLLAYFGTKGDTAAEEDRVRATIALSRPIFTDPNVASLMEHNGYDVSGWNGKKVNSISSAAAFAAADTSVHESSPLASSSTTTDGTTTTTTASASSRSAATTPITTLLGKPLPAKKRPKSSFCSRLVHLLLVLLTVLVASLMAWSIVSGSLYVLPSVFGRTRNSNSSHPLVTTSSTSTPIRNTSTSTSTSTSTATITTSATDKEKGSNYSQNLPHTMEGYLRLGYASISSWMGQKLSQQERKEDTDTTTSDNDVVVNNNEEEVEKDDDTTIVIDDDKEKENDRRDRMDGSDEIIDLDL